MVVPKKKEKIVDGRPTKYTEEMSDVICDKIGNGESLNAICKDIQKDLSDGETITRTTVYNWLGDERYKVFLDKYICARERQAETFIDQCVDIADDNDNDVVVLVNKEGQEYEKVNHDHINRSRLRVDTRIKIAERMAPRKYAIQHLEVSGPDKGPIEVGTNAETMRRLAFLLRKSTEEESSGAAGA